GTRRGMGAAASEAGVVSMAPEDVVERGRLGPGQMLLVDTRDGSLLRDSDAKERAASRHDYALLADRVLVPVERHHLDLEPLDDLPAHHAMHGWGTEDVKFVVEVMAETGAEPVYSMGDDIPIAPLGRTPRPSSRACWSARPSSTRPVRPANRCATRSTACATRPRAWRAWSR